MIKGNITKSSGEISRTYLILGGIIIAVIIIAVIVISIVRKPDSSLPGEEEIIQELANEVLVGDIRFKLKEAKDRGNILKVPETEYSFVEDLTTTEKFIEVTISAENIGKENIQAGYWDINELIDSKERIFYSSREANPWIPEESKCGALLKPGFSPTLCTKIYEVAKISTGLKVRVSSKQPLRDVLFPGKQVFYIDLGL